MPLVSQEVCEVSEKIPKESLGSLGGCLVDGDAEQRHRERRVRHRALVLSILLQTAVLALVVLLPLFGKTEHIALAIATPIPPYGHPHHATGTTNSRPGRPSNPGIHYIFSTPTISPIPQSDRVDGPVGPADISGSGGNEHASGPECSWCVNIGDRNTGPRPPQPVTETPSKPRVIQETRIDPAMLIRRVEPIYPTLAKQTHREGRWNYERSSPRTARFNRCKL